MGILEAIVSDVPNFVKDIPRVPKCVPRWGSTPKYFLMGSKMKLWITHVRMGVPKAIDLDIPNLLKDVPDAFKDVPRVPKRVSPWGSTLNHFLIGF